MAKSVNQFSTFFVGDRMYGIDVARVQEVTQSMPVTKVPLSPPFIHGLINLRGQIATAIGLNDLFELNLTPGSEYMNVVCSDNGVMVSLLVDEIGDVIEVSNEAFEETPATVHPGVSKFMIGVYKTPQNLLSVLNIDKIINLLNDSEGK